MVDLDEMRWETELDTMQIDESSPDPLDGEGEVDEIRYLLWLHREVKSLI